MPANCDKLVDCLKTMTVGERFRALVFMAKNWHLLQIGKRQERCINCEDKATIRGVCRQCYNTMRYKVRKGSRWGEFEGLGQVLPSTRR